MYVLSVLSSWIVPGSAHYETYYCGHELCQNCLIDWYGLKLIGLTTVEPPIMEPPTRGQPLIRDTLHGTVCTFSVI